MTAVPGQTIAPILTGAPSGLVGTLTRAIVAVPSGTVLVAAATAGITEFVQGGGVSNYQASVLVPTSAQNGNYSIVWANGANVVYEDLTIAGWLPAVSIISLAEYKTRAGITSSTNDAKIQAALDGAAAAIRAYTGRDFASSNSSETRAYQYDGRGFLSIDDVSVVTAVTLDGQALVDGQSYYLGPDRGETTPDGGLIYQWIELRQFRDISPAMGFAYNLDKLWPRVLNRRATVAVTGTFGWPSPPADVKQAAFWTVGSFLSEREDGFESEAIDSYSYSLGSGGQDGLNAGDEAIPPRAKDLLWPYRRW